MSKCESLQFNLILVNWLSVSSTYLWIFLYYFQKSRHTSWPWVVFPYPLGTKTIRIIELYKIVYCIKNILYNIFYKNISKNFHSPTADCTTHIQIRPPKKEHWLFWMEDNFELLTSYRTQFPNKWVASILNFQTNEINKSLLSMTICSKFHSNTLFIISNLNIK